MNQKHTHLGHGLQGGYFTHEDLQTLINSGGTGVYVSLGETAHGDPALVAKAVTVDRTLLVRPAKPADAPERTLGGPVLPIVSYPVPPMPVPGGGD